MPATEHVYSLDGTHLQATISATYNVLTSVLGIPGKPVDEYKTRAEWMVWTPHGLGTVYDYKKHDTPLEGVTAWSIGGHNRATAAYIEGLFTGMSAEVELYG